MVMTGVVCEGSVHSVSSHVHSASSSQKKVMMICSKNYSSRIQNYEDFIAASRIHLISELTIQWVNIEHGFRKYANDCSSFSLLIDEVFHISLYF